MPDGDYQLRLKSLNKVFRRTGGQDVRAIDDITIDIQKGEFLVLLGPSGCGKTTLLRCVAGLEQPDSGIISLGGVDVFDSENSIDTPPENRRIGMVFQSYALWPHMSVAENIAYPLKRRGAAKKEILQKVARILEMMRISELADQHPGQISGGQQQRVALARALVCGDNLILFDEPLSNVDAKVREHLRQELQSMQREMGFTALYVTHDQEEAMGLATRIAVISEGRVAQLDTPQEIYFSPTSIEVARFIGSINQFDGKITGRDKAVEIETEFGLLKLPLTATPHSIGAKVSVISRPELWAISTTRLEGPLSWLGEISIAEFLGAHNEYLIDVGDQKIQIRHLGSKLLPVGTKVWCSVDAQSFVVLDCE